MRGNKFFFEKDQPYHIVTKAIAGRKIFESEEDCLRFIFYLYVANIGSPARNLWRQDIEKIARAILNGEKISSKFILNEHPPLVYILDFSLVIDHNHLYLVPTIENGIPIYIHKLNTAFGKYLSVKYNLRGGIFTRRYGRVRIETNYQSDAVSRYVSIINPLDVFQPGWKQEGLKNWQKAFRFLKNYQYSSFPDKIGARKSKILAPDEILEKYLTLGVDSKVYKEFVRDFLKQKLKNYQKLFLE